MALVGFQYEPVSLDLNEVYFDSQDQEKFKALLIGVDARKET